MRASPLDRRPFDPGLWPGNEMTIIMVRTHDAEEFRQLALKAEESAPGSPVRLSPADRALRAKPLIRSSPVDDGDRPSPPVLRARLPGLGDEVNRACSHVLF